ncbi:hypothetical protein Q8A64_03180 [Oxalobacteraceae bacterium R-40]|uniref:Uncharacterized protein n=1 Tax=Keguizhuia sedimenti TaxID=3064264 RepID=A0ABU1BKJ6_9BURK|nr:hypothetical protein [Oxalobacteraceae bacterium R-40]
MFSFFSGYGSDIGQCRRQLAIASSHSAEHGVCFFPLMMHGAFYLRIYRCAVTHIGFISLLEDMEKRVALRFLFSFDTRLARTVIIAIALESAGWPIQA